MGGRYTKLLVMFAPASNRACHRQPALRVLLPPEAPFSRLLSLALKSRARSMEQWFSRAPRLAFLRESLKDGPARFSFARHPRAVFVSRFPCVSDFMDCHVAGDGPRDPGGHHPRTAVHQAAQPALLPHRRQSLSRVSGARGERRFLRPDLSRRFVRMRDRRIDRPFQVLFRRCSSCSRDSLCRPSFVTTREPRHIQTGRVSVSLAHQ